jgi:Lactoylglutathione lyase and related lyases
MKLLSGYVYIPVSDFDEAATWYNAILGFELVFSDPLYRELRSPSGIRIMLIERRGEINSHMMYDTGAQASYGFSVNDIEGIHSELASKGVKTKKTSEYQGKSFSFLDMDGNIIELWEEQNNSKQ